MKSQNKHLQVRLQLMQLLAENPRLSQREMSRKMGVALGSVNNCLSRLIDKGFVKPENFKHPDNRLRYAYMLTPVGLEEKLRLTILFLRHRLEEYAEIKAQIRELSQDLARQNPSLLDTMNLTHEILEE